MARSRKRPKKLVVGAVHVRPIRERSTTAQDGHWYWRAEIHRDGASETVWTGWETREGVERLVAERVAAGTIESAREPETPAVETVLDLFETWVAAQEDRPNLSTHTVLGYRHAARKIVAVLREVRLDRVDVTTLHRLRDERLRAGGATGTVDMELGVFRMAWRWGQEVGCCPARTLPRVSVKVTPSRNRRTPSRADVVAVLGVMSGWSRLAVRLLFATGARIGEISRLTWKDIDFDEALIRVEGKTGERHIPLETGVLAELRAYRGDAPASAGIFGVNTGTVRGQVRVKYLPRACEAAGVPGFSPHGLRRAAADACARSGVDIGTAAALLGHSPKVMLEHYRQVTVDDRRQAVVRARLGHLDDLKVIPFRSKGSEG